MCVKRSRGSLSGLNLSASTSARQLTSAGLRCQFLSRKPRSNLYVGVIPNSCGGTLPSLAPEVCRVPSRWLCRLCWPFLRNSGSPAPSLVELLGHLERCVERHGTKRAHQRASTVSTFCKEGSCTRLWFPSFVPLVHNVEHIAPTTESQERRAII